MSEFSAEELFDAIDREVLDVLERHNLDGPPVDAEALAQDEFDLLVREATDEDQAPQPGRFGPRPARRPGFREVVIRPEATDQARQLICAKACAREIVPRVFTRLKAPFDRDNRSANAQVVGFIMPRLLLPTRWFRRDARKLQFHVLELRDIYATATYEMVAQRLLDIADDDPVVVAVADDGSVVYRKANQGSPGRTLTAAEDKARRIAEETQEPAKARLAGWTSWAYPVPDGPYHRIILRSVPDDL